MNTLNPSCCVIHCMILLFFYPIYSMENENFTPEKLSQQETMLSYIDQFHGSSEGSIRTKQIFDSVKNELGLGQTNNIFLRADPKITDKCSLQEYLQLHQTIINGGYYYQYYVLAYDENWYDLWDYSNKETTFTFAKLLSLLISNNDSNNLPSDIAIAIKFKCARDGARLLKIYQYFNEKNANIHAQNQSLKLQYRIKGLENLADTQREPQIFQRIIPTYEKIMNRQKFTQE